MSVTDVAERERDDQRGHERAEGDQTEGDRSDRLAGVLRSSLGGQDSNIWHGFFLPVGRAQVGFSLSRTKCRENIVALGRKEILRRSPGHRPVVKA